MDTQATDARIEAHRLTTALAVPAGPSLTDPEHFDQARVARTEGDSFLAQVLASAISPEAFDYARRLGVHLSATEAAEQARRAALTEHEQAIEARLDRLRVDAEAKRRFDVERFGEQVGLRPVPLDELMSWESPDWLVETLLVESSVAFLAGASNIGKTFAALDLALSVATGRDFLDLPTKRGRVLYLAGEGLPGLKKRVRSWMDHHDAKPEPDAFQLISTGAVLSDPQKVEELVSIVHEGQFALVVIDTFSQLSGVEQENDAAQVANVIRNAAKLRDAAPGCCVLFIHHMNAEGTKLRGSTAITANADTVIKAELMNKEDDTSPFMLTTWRSKGGKQKDAEGTKIDGLVLRSVGESAVVSRETVSAFFDVNTVEGRGVRTFEQSLEMRDYTTSELLDIAEAMPMSRASAERTISRAVTEGVLVKVARGVYQPASVLASLLPD